MLITRRTALLSAAATSTFSIISSRSRAADTMKIGVVSPLTGRFVASADAATPPLHKGAPLSAGTLRQRLGEVRPLPGRAPRVVRE